MISALDFRSEGRWFVAQFPPSCCFLTQETLPHIVSLHPRKGGGGSRQYSQLLMLQKPGSAPAVWTSLARVRLNLAFTKKKGGGGKSLM